MTKHAGQAVACDPLQRDFGEENGSYQKRRKVVDGLLGTLLWESTTVDDRWALLWFLLPFSGVLCVITPLLSSPPHPLRRRCRNLCLRRAHCIAANLEPKRCPDQPNKPPLQTSRSPPSRPATIPKVKESLNCQGGRRGVLTVTTTNHHLQSSSPFMITTNHRSPTPRFGHDNDPRRAASRPEDRSPVTARLQPDKPKISGNGATTLAEIGGGE
ncbi:hypothetical protein Droror1_Dr00010180 [Drosera rotundifolia]